jgi:uncharacterized membrane protein
MRSALARLSVRESVAVIAAAAIIHVGAVWLIPRAIVAYARHVMTNLAGVNGIRHASLPGADWHSVPMPSPDQLYSACAYDVSSHPLVVTADVPDSYWSVSAFASNTDNFFVLDDRGVPSHHARVVFTNREGYRDTAGGTVVRTPTDTGVILFRLLVLDRNDAGALERIQHAARCEPAAD